MKPQRRSNVAAAGILSVTLACLVLTGRVMGHCDTMDGPVVKASRLALEKGDVTGVLKWVKPEYESEVRAAFKKTLPVRALRTEAKDLADMYFFETLVRLHRTGEGAAYTGLKPAGAVEPAVAESDKALEAGSVEELTRKITQLVAEGIRSRFAEAIEKKRHAEESVAAGRQFVQAYIEFVHYVERIHADAAGQASPHGQTEPAGVQAGHEH
jgi:hypothetical protein